MTENINGLNIVVPGTIAGSAADGDFGAGVYWYVPEIVPDCIAV